MGEPGSAVVIGRSPEISEVVHRISTIAKFDMNLLLEGETGTGKELLARLLHGRSGRSSQPFVPINCAAIPPEIAESEIFGHVRGAFSQAFDTRPGLLELAHGGTLFLDEVALLPFALQGKLLRVLQDGTYRRVGDPAERRGDVRIVAACNTNLREEARAGRFRMDLYFRLAIMTLRVPPLRERREDIPQLIAGFVDRFSARYGVARPQILPDTLSRLVEARWEGNVRELENTVHRIVCLFPGRAVSVELLERDGQVPAPEHEPDSGSDAELGLPGGEPHAVNAELSFQHQKAAVVTEFERSYLIHLLERCRGNVSEAARVSGKHRRSLTQLLEKYSIDAHAFRR